MFHLIMFTLLIGLFFLPTIFALKKKHPQKIPIIIVNIFGGLVYGLGWVVAMVWCFIEPNKPEKIDNTSIADELDKLHNLKEKGALTQDEFDLKKEQLLNQ